MDIYASIKQSFFSKSNLLETHSKFRFEILNPLATYKITNNEGIFMGGFGPICGLVDNFITPNKN